MSDDLKRADMPPSRRSRQYDLFTEFYGDGDYSNTADLWDAVPKSCVTARKQAALRSEDGRLLPFEHGFTHAGKAYRVKILPALLEDQDGVHRDYFPSMDEELVEEVLRKFFADQRHGVHDHQQAESWVRFTLSMVRKELKARGRTRSLNEIKRSLEIMSRCNVSIYVGDSKEPAFSGSIFSDVLRVTRQAYVEDGKSTWAARLPVLVSKSVNDATYRQFNYGILMGLDSQFSRWLHKRMSHRYTGAGALHPYTIKLSTLTQDSGLLNNPKISRRVIAVERTLEELVAADVLMGWDKEERHGHRKRLEDVLYTLRPSQTFTSEMTAMNARHEQIDKALGKRF